MLGILILNFNANANIFRVNSSLTTDASQKLYKTINEAVTAAAAGDTLMIEGSSIVYSDATINKSLVLIGPGYFLTQNQETQANGSPATVQQITIQSAASNTVLEGLTFSNSESYYVPYVTGNNIIITRCYFPHPINLENNISSITMTDNYFVGDAVYVSESYYSFNNVEFSNNYVGGLINITSSDEYPRIFSSVENNIFAGAVTLTATDFRSNILTSTATSTISSANIQNNLFAGTALAGTGNITYNAAQLFVGATGSSTDGQYKLLTTSPYLKSGYGNTQPGIFGGSEPYVLSGLPPVPSIYELDAPNAANKQTGLSVEIKVKANQ